MVQPGNGAHQGVPAMSRRDFAPPPTLSQIQRVTCWVWLVCNGCRHFCPVTLAPFVIRWGPDASSDRLRNAARCERCGTKGAVLQHPSWTGSETGFQTYVGALAQVTELDRLKAEFHNGSRPSGLVRRNTSAL